MDESCVGSRFYFEMVRRALKVVQPRIDILGLENYDAEEVEDLDQIFRGPPCAPGTPAHRCPKIRLFNAWFRIFQQPPRAIDKVNLSAHACFQNLPKLYPRLGKICGRLSEEPVTPELIADLRELLDPLVSGMLWASCALIPEPGTHQAADDFVVLLQNRGMFWRSLAVVVKLLGKFPASQAAIAEMPQLVAMAGALETILDRYHPMDRMLLQMTNMWLPPIPSSGLPTGPIVSGENRGWSTPEARRRRRVIRATLAARSRVWSDRLAPQSPQNVTSDQIDEALEIRLLEDPLISAWQEPMVMQQQDEEEKKVEEAGEVGPADDVIAAADPGAPRGQFKHASEAPAFQQQQQQEGEDDQRNEDQADEEADEESEQEEERVSDLDAILNLLPLLIQRGQIEPNTVFSWNRS